jgi:UDP-N-acetylmuramate: L-alanyl-gamma-D-glutamyl-meso-diaminopimelate ligase
VKKLLDQTETSCEKIPYETPAFSVSNGHFLLPSSVTNNPAPVFLSFFGTHNLQNMMAAKYACIKAGLNQDQFFEAIQTFKGTAKRLETIKETQDSLVIRDFAHAPSKLRATVNAVRELYPERRIIAAYELHTYSSLNKDFLPHYKDTLAKADIRAVLFSKHALEVKKMPMLDPNEVAAGFGDGVKVFTDKNELHNYLNQFYTGKENLLLMSSGTFDGMNLEF